MKQPFIFIGAAALGISFLTLLCNSFYVIAAAILLLAVPLSLLAIFGKKLSLQNVIITLVMLLLIAASSVLTIETKIKPTERLDGSSLKISATLTEKPDFADTGAFYTFSGYSDRLGRSIKFNLWSDALELDVGDRINANVRIEKLNEEYKSMNLAEGVYVTLSDIEIISVKENDSKLLTAIDSLRKYVKNVLSATARGDRAGILIALITGDRDFISDELYTASKVSGSTHVMVVSGLHIGILSSILLKLMQKLKARQRLAIFLSFAVIVFVVILCDFHTSAIRAAVMSLLTLSGSLINRKADGLNSLGFSVSVMILLSPCLAGSVAFLLSVAATFGVIFVSPLILSRTRRKNADGIFLKALSTLYSAIVVSLSALICTLPISVKYFGYFSLLSPLASLLITFAVSALLVLSAFCVLISPIPVLRLLAKPVLFIASLFGDYIVTVISLLGRCRKFVVTVEPAQADLCFLLCAIFILAIWLLYKRKTLKGPEKDVSE